MAFKGAGILAASFFVAAGSIHADLPGQGPRLGADRITQAEVASGNLGLRDIRLAVGIAGKAFFTMTGELGDIQAAADAARAICGDRLLLLEVIAAPAPDIRGRLLF